MNTVSVSRKTLEDWALSLSQGDISPRWEIEDLLAQPEQPEPCVNCSGSGITPIGDGYSVDACPQCTPEQPEAGRDEAVVDEADWTDRESKLIRLAVYRFMNDAYAKAGYAAQRGTADQVRAFHADAKDAEAVLAKLRTLHPTANAEAARLLRELRDAARAYWDGGMVGAAEKRDRFRLALRAADAYIAAAQKEPCDE